MKERLYLVVTAVLFIGILVMTANHNDKIVVNTTVLNNSKDSLEHSESVPNYHETIDGNNNTKDDKEVSINNEQTEVAVKSSTSQEINNNKLDNKVPDAPVVEYVQRSINGVDMLVPKSISNKSNDYIEDKIKTAATGQFFKEELVSNNIELRNTSSKDWIVNKEIYDQSDYEVLAHLIQSEAGDQPYDGMIAVADVVINRAKKASTGIKNIIFQRRQFDGTQTKWFLVKPSSDCYRAAKEALSGKNIVPSSLHFCDLNLCNPRWAYELKFIVRIGDHWFFE